MAAYSAGMSTVLIPADNEKDLDDIDPTVREALNFVFCKNAEDALSIALLPDKKEKETLQIKTDKAENFSDFIPAIINENPAVSINR